MSGTILCSVAAILHRDSTIIYKRRTTELIERSFEVTVRSTSHCDERFFKSGKLENRLRENPSLSQTASAAPQLLIILWNSGKTGKRRTKITLSCRQCSGDGSHTHCRFFSIGLPASCQTTIYLPHKQRTTHWHWMAHAHTQAWKWETFLGSGCHRTIEVTGLLGTLSCCKWHADVRLSSLYIHPSVWAARLYNTNTLPCHRVHFCLTINIAHTSQCYPRESMPDILLSLRQTHKCMSCDCRRKNIM